MRVGTGVVMIGHANVDVHLIHSPLDAGLTTVIMHVYVHDIDAHYAHAVAEGANVTMELEDAFYGERRYEATDPEGHRWHFGERFDDIRARGGRPPEVDSSESRRPSRLQRLGRQQHLQRCFSHEVHAVGRAFDERLHRRSRGHGELFAADADVESNPAHRAGSVDALAEADHVVFGRAFRVLHASRGDSRTRAQRAADRQPHDDPDERDRGHDHGCQLGRC